MNVNAPRSVAVIGLGLIGGSLCMALRRRLPEVEVIGIARREELAGRAVAWISHLPLVVKIGRAHV